MMEEQYTSETSAADALRSRELIAALPEQSRWAAAELMSISYRAGVDAGKRSVNLAMLFA